MDEAVEAMVICPKCGFKNLRDESVCQNPSCQTVLELNGKVPPRQPVAPPAPPPSHPAPPEVGWFEEELTSPAPPLAPPKPAPAASQTAPPKPAPAASQTAPPKPVPAASQAAPPQAPPSQGARPQAARAQAPPRPRPVTAEEWAWLPPEPETQPVMPVVSAVPVVMDTNAQAEPQAEPQIDAAVPPASAPWQVACHRCGWPNDPTWIDCHHCETRLTLPPVPSTALEAAATRRPEPLPAVAGRERAARVLAAVVLLAVVGVVVVLATGPLRHRGTTATTRPAPSTPATALVAVRPSSVAASTESGERGARNVIDRNLTTYWSRLVPSSDVQPSLQFSFAQPVNLAELQIAAGASGDQFIARPRPQRVELHFSDGSTMQFTLADQRDYQKVAFPARRVTQLRLVILSTYPGSDAPRPSISEIRFLATR